MFLIKQIALFNKKFLLSTKFLLFLPKIFVDWETIKFSLFKPKFWLFQQKIIPIDIFLIASNFLTVYL